MIPAAPKWVEGWARNRRQGGHVKAQKKNVGDSFTGDIPVQGERPDWLEAGFDVAGAVLQAAQEAARHAWDRVEEARLCSALALIPANLDGKTWASYGRAIHDLGWIVGDIDRGFDIWDRWSRTSKGEGPETGAYEGRERLACRWQGWTERGQNYSGLPITVASIYEHARRLGWVPSTNESGNEINGVDALSSVLPAQITANPIKWADTDKFGGPKPTCENTRIALRHMGIACRYDLFHSRQYVNGEAIERWAGEIADDTVLAVRSMIRAHWRLDPPTQTTIDALTMECLDHAYDPVLDYLDGLAWDGRPRLASWTADFLGAENTALNQMIGGLSLVAAVRRVRQPGAKFDHVTVLEGLEGMGKSSAVAILAGSENFSDQEILTLDERRQQEALQGVWLYEIAELAGMHRADIERVKAFVTRTMDRTRPAYGRRRVDKARRCVFFASCNNEHYLLSQTGNRRFWPIKCQWVRTDELAAARDQLWAEASAIEARGTSLVLPQAFWPVAAQVQESRRAQDPWEDILEGIENQKAHVQKFETHWPYEYRVATESLMTHFLRLAEGQRHSGHSHRLGNIMRLLGWDGPKTIRLRIVEQDEKTRHCKGFTKQCHHETR